MGCLAFFHFLSIPLSDNSEICFQPDPSDFKIVFWKLLRCSLGKVGLTLLESQSFPQAAICKSLSVAALMFTLKCAMALCVKCNPGHFYECTFIENSIFNCDTIMVKEVNSYQVVFMNFKAFSYSFSKVTWSAFKLCSMQPPYGFASDILLQSSCNSAGGVSLYI